jgi:hypothetical protein
VYLVDVDAQFDTGSSGCLKASHPFPTGLVLCTHSKSQGLRPPISERIVRLYIYPSSFFNLLHSLSHPERFKMQFHALTVFATIVVAVTAAPAEIVARQAKDTILAASELNARTIEQGVRQKDP